MVIVVVLTMTVVAAVLFLSDRGDYCLFSNREGLGTSV